MSVNPAKLQNLYGGDNLFIKHAFTIASCMIYSWSVNVQGGTFNKEKPLWKSSNIAYMSELSIPLLCSDNKIGSDTTMKQTENQGNR